MGTARRARGSDRGCRQRAAQATACPSSWPCSSCLHLLGGAAFAVSVGVAWLDLTSLAQYVWFSFASARGASEPRPRGAPGRGVRPTSALAHQLTVGQPVHLAPSLDAARGDTEPAIRRGQRTRVEAGARGEPVTPRCCGSAPPSRDDAGGG